MLSRSLKLSKSLPLTRPVLPCIGRRSFAQVSNVEDIPTVGTFPDLLLKITMTDMIFSTKGR